MADWDKFGDIVSENAGIFRSGVGMDDALRRFDSVVQQTTREGVVVEMNCRRCGRPRQITFYWPELVAIACNVNPRRAFASHPQLARFATEWRVAQDQPEHSWVPEDIKCACGEHLRPIVTPHECRDILADMTRRGWLDPRQETWVGNLCIRSR